MPINIATEIPSKVKSFEELVALDVRHECSAEELEILKGDLNHWLRELNGLKRDVEIQMSAQKARITQAQIEYLEKNSTIEWLKFKQQEEHWRVGSLRFMASVEERILYVKGLRAASAAAQKPLVATAS